MIFKDRLNERASEFGSEFDILLKAAFATQSHEGDLLLIYLNGYFEPFNIEWNKRSDIKLSPFVFGIGTDGLSEHSHYLFIDQYRKTHIHELTYQEYLKEISWSEEKSIEIGRLNDKEELEIQSEFLVYLKIWESDMIIKRFYQLLRSIHGEPYDWYFKVQNSSRGNNSTGKRQDLWRLKIRDRLENVSPKIYSLLKNSYITQIRNAISHSNYYFYGREIKLLNYVKEDPASQLKSVTFEEWNDIFHNTLFIFNEYVHLKQEINRKYSEFVLNKNCDFRILATDDSGNQFELPVIYRAEHDQWHFLNE